MISFDFSSKQAEMQIVLGTSGQIYYSIRIRDNDGTRDYLIPEGEKLKFSDGIKGAEELYKSLQTKF